MFIISERINYLDFLKFVGLACIILAHVNSPDTVMMIRNFDVPLMVIISSLLADRHCKKHLQGKKSVFKYYVARFARLVIPTWIFLLFFFATEYVITRDFYDIKYYFYSFALTKYGIKYVWIILIYMFSAFLVPLFYYTKNSVKYLVIFISIYVIYEVAYYFGLGIDNKFLDSTVYYIIPYGLLTYLGFNYLSFKKRTRLLVFMVSGCLFLGFAAYYFITSGSFQNVQIAKYPPRLYYLGYGVACSFGLLMLCENFNCKLFDNCIIRFISTHSLWIYLWHIMILENSYYLHLPDAWYFKYIIVFASSVLIVFVITKFFDLIEKRYKFAFLKLRKFIT